MRGYGSRSQPSDRLLLASIDRGTSLLYGTGLGWQLLLLPVSRESPPMDTFGADGDN